MADIRKVRFDMQQKLKLSTSTSFRTSGELNPMRVRRNTVNPLEELVQCTLCMDKLTDPKMLPCQHTFCFHCLQSQLTADKNELDCPICKETIQLENGLITLENLPENLYINSILKMLSGAETPQTPSMFGPETQCIKCQTMCQFSKHACQHCKQIFCGVCWSVHVTDLKNQLISLQEQLNESQNRLNHRVDDFNDRCLQLENSIKAATEMKIQEIKTKETECLLEAEKVKENGMRSSKELRDRIKELENNIQTNDLDKITDDNQKITHFMFLHRGTATLLDELSRWGDTRTIFDAINFKIDYETDATPDAETEIEDEQDGNVMSMNIAQNPIENEDRQIAYYKSRSFTPKLVWTKCPRPAGVCIPPWATNCIYIAGTDSRQIYVVDKTKGKLLHRYSSPMMLCPVGVACSQRREELYVTDKWKHCLHVFSKDGDYLRSIGKKGGQYAQFRSPEGIAVSSDNRLFVCDTGNDRIQVMTAEGKFLYSFGITGTQQTTTSAGFLLDYKLTELNIPTGIAVTEDKILVADSGNRRIKIYTLEGEKINEFGSLGKNKGQFRTPEVITVDSHGFIIVGDSGNARVQIFKPNGTLVRVFGHKANLAWVSGLCISPTMDIIVTDYKNHTVNVF